MINKAVCNLLIPFGFEMSDWEKIDDCQEIPQFDELTIKGRATMCNWQEKQVKTWRHI